MGHDKLRKFAENETFSCLLQPSAQEVLARGYFDLQDHAIKGHWNERMFARPAPIVLELGCGKGEYTLDLARRHPERNYIGVDIKGARLWRGAKTATEEGLPNVAFLRTRIEFITAYFAPGEISEIWLTFSDPQLGSENSRLTSPLFLNRYRSFMRPGGVVHLKTDSRFLHEYTRAVVEVNGLRMLACTADLYGGEEASDRHEAEGAALGVSRAELGVSRTERPELFEVQTFYEKMFLAQGYKITYLSFCIDHEGEFVYPTDFDAAYWRSIEGPRKFVQVPE